MKNLAFANDHALSQEDKKELFNHIESLGWTPIDCGSNDTVTAYSTVAIRAAKMVANKECQYGVIICGTGIGISIAANKVKGVRAALVSKPANAAITRLHNDANILAMGRRDMELDDMKESIYNFLTTEFEGGRHISRVDVIKDYENNN